MQPTEIKITIRPKSKSIRLRIDDDLRLIVSAGPFFSESEIKDCIHHNWQWIKERILEKSKLKLSLQQTLQSHQNRFLCFGQWEIFKQQTKTEIKNNLLKVLETRTKDWAKIMQVEYKKICVRYNKRVLGSCSYHNHLSFSLLLYCAPIDLIDYVIVHELSHIKHKNHSKAFWDFCASFYPHYQSSRKILHQNITLYIALFKKYNIC